MLFDNLAARGSEFLGVKYPIICGAMTWVSEYHLGKAISDNGAFPVLAAGNMTADVFEREVDTWIAGIKTPFAVNLVTISPNFKSQQEVLFSKNVPIAVFAGSFPRRAEIQKMQKSGKRVMSFASAESIAAQQIKFGVDALIVEGSEAGGHIGHVSLLVLLQQVLFRFNQVPIFAGGGVATGRMVAQLMLMGASGIQMGTRFVMTEECRAHPRFKEVFIKSRAREAVSTPQYDSKLPVVAVRAIKNQGMADFGKLQLKLIRLLDQGEISREKAQFEVEHYWMGTLRNAVVEGDVHYGSLMAGQSVGLVEKIQPMKEVMESIINEAEAELQRVKARIAGL